MPLTVSRVLTDKIPTAEQHGSTPMHSLSEKFIDTPNSYKVTLLRSSSAVVYSAVIHWPTPVSLPTKEHLLQISRSIRNYTSCIFSFMVSFCGDKEVFSFKIVIRAKGILTAIYRLMIGK